MHGNSPCRNTAGANGLGPGMTVRPGYEVFQSCRDSIISTCRPPAPPPPPPPLFTNPAK
ncbi:hypothetical protein SK128_015995, partial [Halocaridina rubra]